ncbi:hypothetical protein CDL15_Pgr014741 [Punica granatum]|uniref:Uncharacterized protein n=1 Tax=Punica granatum TaxID=22663 RepID=A0A218Y064_PUNGR|nr:hypothetical protein CDL15_Pgr014741 [Punica granatum]PKI78019.1 hypothetical protein CRG98_001639 [Punica granatum]
MDRGLQPSRIPSPPPARAVEPGLDKKIEMIDYESDLKFSWICKTCKEEVNKLIMYSLKAHHYYKKGKGIKKSEEHLKKAGKAKTKGRSKAPSKKKGGGVEGSSTTSRGP